MSSNFNKVLYLGANIDLDVVTYFPNCNEFVLIDTMPRSEHDEKNYFFDGFYRMDFIARLINKCKKYGFTLNDTIEFEPNYINLIDNIERLPEGKDLKSIPYINPHLLIFTNKGDTSQLVESRGSDNESQLVEPLGSDNASQLVEPLGSEVNRIIKYYISTNILFNMNPMLEKDIYESDTLYNSGYHPDCELLKYLTNKKRNFVGSSKTCYYDEQSFNDDSDNNIIKYFIKTNTMNDYFDNYYLVWKKKSMIILCDSLEDINNKKKLL